MERIYCTHCGHQNPEGANYCANCGPPLADVGDPEPRITVERPGMLTTVQDWPGRIGLWQVGVPPSGPMDDLSFRLGNRALGNPEGAPGLECTLGGPALRFRTAATVMVTGAPAHVCHVQSTSNQFTPRVLQLIGAAQIPRVRDEHPDGRQRGYGRHQPGDRAGGHSAALDELRGADEADRPDKAVAGDQDVIP